MTEGRNVFGEPLAECCTKPMTDLRGGIPQRFQQLGNGRVFLVQTDRCG